MTPPRHTRVAASPVGPLLLESDGESLTGIALPRVGARAPAGAGPGPGPDGGVLDEAARQLAEYFARERTSFDLPVRPAGTTFQLSVWDELTRIPYGSTVTYGELARRVGRPRGPRAVGQANGRNPVPIVVPCHRVVAANGIGGYSGGLDTKRLLLALERSSPPGHT
ncbi:MAG: methylated-DNA--[protein]-cysteine S-methyltransferase [Actinomycetota bacterium]|nr:methylated-DNA--[protein]-cysteine S-methyltransferase [Actinomycetota bacterium]